jgi:hypothetical protein
MSDSVTNLVGNTEQRAAATTAYQNAKVPLSDLFSNVLNKTSFADQMLPKSDFGLARAAERDFEVGRDAHAEDHDRAEADPADDGSSEVRDNDDRSQEGDDGETEAQSDDQPRDDGAADAQQVADAATDETLLALNAAAIGAEKTGHTVQPNAASGVELQAKGDGAATDKARAIVTRGDIQAAANNAANTDKAQAQGQDAASRANAALANNQANPTGLKADTAEAKAGPNIDMAATDKSQASKAPVLTQTQGMADGDADGMNAALEKHTLLIRDGAHRAAELHEMKIRVMAHRDAIKKAIAQNINGAQAQTTAPGANKPAIEITTNITPPAPAAIDGPAARPVNLFNSAAPGTLPGQAGNGSTTMAIGDSVGNGANQLAGAAERQPMTASSTLAMTARPMPSQPAFQPAEQVKVHIQQLVKSDADRIQIKLSPASLGKVEITLEVSPDKAVQAIVYAEKPETLDMLERDARVLQQAFEEAGMKFDQNSLMFKHGQSGDSQTELAEDSGSSENGAATDGEGSETGDIPANEQPSRRQHDGMLDLEI